MATSFPTGIDAFPAPGAGVPMNTPGLLEHDIQHANVNSAISAIETKLGINSSADVNSVDKKLATVISSQASTAATVVTLSSTVSGFTTSIANLQIANVNGPASQGRVFVPASATSGTAINSAIASLPASGGTVLLGAGTHVINTGILFDRFITLEGVHKAATILTFTPGTVPTCMAMADTTQRRIDLKNFTILSNTNGAGTAIAAFYFVDSLIEEVYIGGNNTNSPNIGIDFNAGVAGTYYNHVHMCRIFTGGAAPICIRFDNNSNSNAVSHTRLGCASPSSTGVGVFIDRCYSILLTHIDMESCDAIGVDVGGNTGASSATTRDITLLNCYFEAITIGLRTASGSIAVTMLGGQLNNCTTADFQDNGCQTLRLINTTYEGHAYGYSSHPASRVIRTAGTYSLTHAEVYGASALRIRLVGGGGGGYGAATTTAGNLSVGGGGQAGAYTEVTVRTEDLTFPVSIVIGGGGAGGNNAAGANGAAGANSTFGGTLVTAPGGAGGTGSATGSGVTYQLGGTGSNAGTTAAPVSATTAIILAGSEGGVGTRLSGTNGFPGFGAASTLGAATSPANSQTNANGVNGYQYGSGGSGSLNANATGGTHVGGNGADGVCVIELLY